MNITDQAIMNVTMLGGLMETAENAFGITAEMLFSPEQQQVLAQYVGSLPDDEETHNRSAVILVSTIREIAQRVMQDAQQQSSDVQ